MTYAIDHTGAVSMIRESGSAVTWSVVTYPNYNQTTGDPGTPTTTSVAGYAISTSNDLQQFQALGLTEQDAQTLLFVATAYGQVPALAAKGTWGGTAFTIKSVSRIDPDGNGAIVMRLVVSR